MAELWWAFAKRDELSQEEGCVDWHGVGDVFSSRVPRLLRAPGYPGSLTAHWTIGCSSCLIIQSSRAARALSLAACLWLPSQELGNPVFEPTLAQMIRTSRALWLLFKLTFLLQLANWDATRLSIPQPREHPSCKVQFRCFHSDVSYTFPVCGKYNRVLSTLNLALVQYGTIVWKRNTSLNWKPWLFETSLVTLATLMPIIAYKCTMASREDTAFH